MPRAPTFALAGLALACSVVAGAQNADPYPSLERRPAERFTATFPPPAPPPPQPLPLPGPGVTGPLDMLVGQARSADAGFRGKKTRVRALVNARRGAVLGSDAWSIATIALAELESARGDAVIALSELDGMYNDSVLRGEDPAPIEAARSGVAAMVESENQVLEELKATLGN